jgi:hypothetical protein
MRKTLEQRGSLKSEKERWSEDTELFKEEFRQLSIYPED